jgi:hypothetical protein
VLLKGSRGVGLERVATALEAGEPATGPAALSSRSAAGRR